MATGKLITVANVRADVRRWPWFAAAAAKAGLVLITAVPIRSRADVIGALGLLGGTAPDAAGIRLARSLADAAAAGLALADEFRRRETAITQLQSALTSRIVIEQAKGILAERWSVAPDEAFDRLRRHARSAQRRLHDVAAAVISGRTDLAPPDASTSPAVPRKRERRS